jgi:diaminohydroxyphosphoribosylaminopyrimidine deaminase/5-amino-6-(5-phosphoribosylamino)uracil reductase
LKEAISYAKFCPPSRTAFSVGALIVAENGIILATGYSREGDPANHAEEVALSKVDPKNPRLATATMYTSLEPCSTRASRPKSCTQHILDSPIKRVVFAWSEPAIFVDCVGAQTLANHGLEVIQFEDLADQARQLNLHLLG